MPGNTYCAVLGCKNNFKADKGLTFFRLPFNREMVEEWTKAIGRPDLLLKKNPRAYRVCGIHFTPAMLINKRLKNSAIPTLHLPDVSDMIDDVKVKEEVEDVYSPESAKGTPVDPLPGTSKTSSSEVTSQSSLDKGVLLQGHYRNKFDFMITTSIETVTPQKFEGILNVDSSEFDYVLENDYSNDVKPEFQDDQILQIQPKTEPENFESPELCTTEDSVENMNIKQEDQDDAELPSTTVVTASLLYNILQSSSTPKNLHSVVVQNDTKIQKRKLANSKTLPSQPKKNKNESVTNSDRFSSVLSSKDSRVVVKRTYSRGNKNFNNKKLDECNRRELDKTKDHLDEKPIGIDLTEDSTNSETHFVRGGKVMLPFLGALPDFQEKQVKIADEPTLSSRAIVNEVQNRIVEVSQQKFDKLIKQHLKKRPKLKNSSHKRHAKTKKITRNDTRKECKKTKLPKNDTRKESRKTKMLKKDTRKESSKPKVPKNDIWETSEKTYSSAPQNIRTKYSHFNTYKLATPELRFSFKCNIYGKELDDFASYLYSSSPLIYKILSRIGALPKSGEHQENQILLKSGVSDDLVTFLSKAIYKSHKKYKYCTISISDVELERNIFYDIQVDEIIGVAEIGSVKNREIATHAFALFLNGCFEDYKQPLGYGFTGTRKSFKDIGNLLLKTIEKLYCFGFEVCAVISDESFIGLAHFLNVTAEHPFFTVNNKDVLYIFDMPSLVKGLGKSLCKFDFSYGTEEHCVSWNHLKAFYNRDKVRGIRLAPKLTDALISGDWELADGAHVFDRAVAAGIALDVENNHQPASARKTADFILHVSQFLHSLNSGNSLFDFNNQKELFALCMEIFDDIKAFEVSIEEDMMHYTDDVFTGIKITIKSVSRLRKYFSPIVRNDFETKSIQLDGINRFLESIQDSPTARKLKPLEFRIAASKIITDYTCDYVIRSMCRFDLDSVFQWKDKTLKALFEDDVTVHLAPGIDMNDSDCSLNPERPLESLSAYLLNKCTKRHFCVELYRHKVDNSTEASDDFIEFVEMHERKFLEKTDEIALVKDVSKQFIDMFKKVYLSTKPCFCFPLKYFIQLYLKVRVEAENKHLNKLVSSSPVYFMSSERFVKTSM